MNIKYDAPINGYVLPDPWTSNVRPFPEALMPYHRFVQAHVQEYTNDRVPLSRADYVKFLRFMLGHGLSASTAGAIAKQLLSERNGRYRWRRAAIMDRLQFDLFRAAYRRLRPHFSTFFLNSTAHLQHMYWRNLEPEAFTLKPRADEQGELASAILFGYQTMDRLVAEFRRLVGEDGTKLEHEVFEVCFEKWMHTEAWGGIYFKTAFTRSWAIARQRRTPTCQN